MDNLFLISSILWVYSTSIAINSESGIDAYAMKYNILGKNACQYYIYKSPNSLAYIKANEIVCNVINVYDPGSILRTKNY